MDLFYNTAKYTMDNISFIDTKNRSTSINSLFDKKITIRSILYQWVEILNDIGNLVINNNNKYIPNDQEMDKLILKFIQYKRDDIIESIKILNIFIKDRSIPKIPFFRYVINAILDSMDTDTSLYVNVQSTHNIIAMRNDTKKDSTSFFQHYFDKFDPDKLSSENYNSNNNYFNKLPLSHSYKQSPPNTNYNINAYYKNTNNTKPNYPNKPQLHPSALLKTESEVNNMMKNIGKTYSLKMPECVYHNKGRCKKTEENCSKKHVCLLDGDTKHGLWQCPIYLEAIKNN